MLAPGLAAVVGVAYLGYFFIVLVLGSCCSVSYLGYFFIVLALGSCCCSFIGYIIKNKGILNTQSSNI